VNIESEVAYLVITSTQHHRYADRVIQAAGDGSDESSIKRWFWPELSCWRVNGDVTARRLGFA
jgi:hypothetical protein